MALRMEDSSAKVTRELIQGFVRRDLIRLSLEEEELRDEPAIDNDIVVLQDTTTGNRILCSGRLHREIKHHEELVKRKSAGVAPFKGGAGHQIVCHGKNCAPCFQGEGVAGGLSMYHDSMAGPEEINAHKAVLQFATHMACTLTSGDAALHCMNGRSRSPAVCVAFFLVFRGGLEMQLDALLGWVLCVLPRRC